MRLTVQDNDPFDFDMPLFQSGESVHYELSLSPDELNECPELHRIQVQLIQHYSPAIGQTSTRVAATLWNEVIDAREAIDFQESFVPPPGAGTYAIVAIVRDEQGNALMSRTSDFFHVQLTLDPGRPVFIAFNSPYHGQVVQRGALLHVAYALESVTGDRFRYRIEILNEDDEVVRVIAENDSEETLDTGGMGAIDTDTPGQYTIRARTWDFDPVTFVMHLNAAGSEYTIEN